MKRLIHIPALLCSLAAMGQFGFSTASLDPAKLLPVLFDAAPTGKLNEVKWKPDFGERQHLPTVTDPFVYTRVDTTFYLTSAKDKAVVVFRTYVPEQTEDAGMCAACTEHIGVALFNQTVDFRTKAKSWFLTSFHKWLMEQGIHEVRLPVQLVQLGKEFRALRIDSSEGDEVQRTTSANFFELGADRPILHVEMNGIHMSGVGMDMTEEVVERQIKILPSAKEMFDVEVRTAGDPKPAVYVYDPTTLGYGRKN